MSSIIRKLATSRWILTIAAILTAHYLVVIYYSSIGSTSSTRDVNTVSADMSESRLVYFPVNKQYYPDKSSSSQTVKPPSGKVQVKTIKPIASETISNTTLGKENKTHVASNTSAHNSSPAKAIVSKSSPGKQSRGITQKTSNLSAAAVTSKSTKIILAWTILTSRKPLWGIQPWAFKYCEYKNCKISGNRILLSQADLLIFRIRELKAVMTAEPYRMYVRPIDHSDLPAYHKPSQMWMDINQESPIFTQADEELTRLNGIFNLSSNYLLDSDFSLSYIPMVKEVKVATSDDSRKPVDYSAGKTKMALWFVSHCGAGSGRDEYVKELQKYNISVDVFGKCTGKSDGCASGNHTCYDEVRSKYKFYLAFENSICSEYITEKFWNTLTSKSYNIPIALGATLKQYQQFSPPNSYLHTRNFTSVKALATFMNKLDKDKEAYNSYHKWRETHKIVPRDTKESLHCYMCRQANIKKDGKAKYKHISKYWSRKNNCELKPEPIT